MLNKDITERTERIDRSRIERRSEDKEIKMNKDHIDNLKDYEKLLAKTELERIKILEANKLLDFDKKILKTIKSKPVELFERYILFPTGRVINKDTAKDIIPSDGVITLYERGTTGKEYFDRKHIFRIHKLVADYFIPNPNSYRYLLFRDNTPQGRLNYSADNLYWNKKNISSIFCMIDKDGMPRLYRGFDDIRNNTGISVNAIYALLKNEKDVVGDFVSCNYIHKYLEAI